MTDEEIKAIGEEAMGLLSRKPKDYEEATNNSVRVQEINRIIHRETKRRIEQGYRDDGIDPYAPCPTCGHAPMRDGS